MSLRAIDLRTGKTLRDRALGEARTNSPFYIPSMLPLMIGTPNKGGSVVTAPALSARAGPDEEAQFHIAEWRSKARIQQQ